MYQYQPNASMRKIIHRTIFISCLLMTACAGKQPPTSTEIPVNLYHAQTQPILYYDQYPATITALNQVNLIPQISGAITGIFFKEGSYVREGQKLYEIDAHIYKANYDAALANLQVVQGNLAQAQQDADRYEYLDKYHAVAKQLYDHAITTLKNAKNQVKASEETVKTAKTNLNYTIITAPFDGTIGFSQVKVGTIVSPGSTVLNTISTDNPMAVDFVINEKQLSRFEQIQKDKSSSVDSLFTMLLSDNSLYPHTGKISIIDRAIDSQTGAIRIRLVFPNPKASLRAGMSCVVRVRNEETSPQLVIPGKAVVEQMGEYFVYVAKDSSTFSEANSSTKKEKSQLVAVQKKVQLGQTIGPNVIIKSGIDVNEQVVVDGIQSLHNGSSITTTNIVPPGQGGKK